MAPWCAIFCGICFSVLQSEINYQTRETDDDNAVCRSQSNYDASMLLYVWKYGNNTSNDDGHMACHLFAHKNIHHLKQKRCEVSMIRYLLMTQ